MDRTDDKGHVRSIYLRRTNWVYSFSASILLAGSQEEM